MKKIFFAAICALILISCKTTKTAGTQIPAPSSAADALEFKNVWAYVMNGEENAYTSELPVTDIGYFINAVNIYSTIDSFPLKEKKFATAAARVHIVSSVDSKAQTHLLLNPELPLRNRIIDQLTEYSASYDGIQIDWELVTARDKESFQSFLKLLKEKNKDKILSVAVPARMKKLSSDAYDYEDLSKIADKIIVMAYDEHWSSSRPGAVASLDWSRKIAAYCVKVIPQEKLVMGMPFYGRTWRDDTDGGKAYRYSGINRILEQNNLEIERDEGNVPNFKYSKNLNIEGWFEDALSLYTKCQAYKEMKVQNIAFWRLGQDDPLWWQYLKIE